MQEILTSLIKLEEPWISLGVYNPSFADFFRFFIDTKDPEYRNFIRSDWHWTPALPFNSDASYNLFLRTDLYSFLANNPHQFGIYEVNHFDSDELFLHFDQEGVEIAFFLKFSVDLSGKAMYNKHARKNL